MLYKYRAKKGPQEITEGTIEAQSEREAIEKLNQAGFVPLSIRQETKGMRISSYSARPSGRIGSSELTVLSRQLASLIKSGVPILRSLDIVAEQSENRSLQEVIRNIHDAVKDGASFSSALSKYPNIFSPLYIAMIRTGENSGSLPEVLLRLVDFRAKQEEMLSRFRMALAYPLFMACVGAATVIFMLTFVMPRLMGIFVTMGEQLPLPTKALIAISKGLRQWWFWILAVVFIGAAITKRQLKTKIGRAALSVFQVHLPLLGTFIVKSELSRFCSTLELLLKSGIPILKALDIAIPVLDNEVLKNQLKNSYKELEQGGSFGKSLKNSSAFPLFITNLLIVGEESGKLDDALAEVANTYERDTDEAMKVMANLLEPLMILVMGVIVGFIVVSMLLPIFQINLMVR